MKIFIIILFIIYLTSHVSSIVFTCLSFKLWNKMSVHEKDNYYIVYTTHELYPKYNKYKKLGDNLLLLSAVFGILLGIMGYIY